MRVSALFALSAVLAPCITAAPLNAHLNTTTTALSTQGATEVFPPELLPLLKAIMEDEKMHPRSEEDMRHFRYDKEEEKHLQPEERGKNKMPLWKQQLRCYWVCWRPRLAGSEKICVICRRRTFYPWPQYWLED
ncbi:hypothetical protein IQ07DRAFT_583400 [Pyrenochaeta sp. DS3sAY3a]|nr:hypothetical protein IQ07DRAFT_583400 [Pyrenochaeta sp. DS3sAY3a]